MISQRKWRLRSRERSSTFRCVSVVRAASSLHPITSSWQAAGEPVSTPSQSRRARLRASSAAPLRSTGASKRYSLCLLQNKRKNTSLDVTRNKNKKYFEMKRKSQNKTARFLLKKISLFHFNLSQNKNWVSKRRTVDLEIHST